MNISLIHESTHVLEVAPPTRPFNEVSRLFPSLSTRSLLNPAMFRMLLIRLEVRERVSSCESIGLAPSIWHGLSEQIPRYSTTDLLEVVVIQIHLAYSPHRLLWLELSTEISGARIVWSEQGTLRREL